MSALPKRPGLLTAAQLQLSAAHKRRLSRTLQTLAASQLSSSLQPPLSPPPSGVQLQGPYPPAPYPALLSLGTAHSSAHPHPPPPARAHRPPKKSTTTLFPNPPSAPLAPSAPAARERERVALWSVTSEDAKEQEERDGQGRRWGFNAGASGLPKHGGACVTRGGGVVQVGEDCYFVLPDSMGVSDGVGGLKGPRCNPGLFAASLISHASSLMSPSASPSTTPSSILSQSPASSSDRLPPPPIPSLSSAPSSFASSSESPASRQPMDPHPALLNATTLTLSAFALEGLHGSATCTLARLYPEEGVLRVAHVGDCELWCVRAEAPAAPGMAASVTAAARTGGASPAAAAGSGVETRERASDAETTRTTAPASTPAKPTGNVATVAAGTEAEAPPQGKLKVVFRTPAMQKGFNHPAQLSTPAPPPPPGRRSPSAQPSPSPSPSTSSGDHNPREHSARAAPDHPAPAPSPSPSLSNAPSTSAKPEILTYSLEVKPRDIILLSSDGVTDNLWEDEILEELQKLRVAPPPLPSSNAPNGLVEGVSAAMAAAAGAAKGAWGGVPSALYGGAGKSVQEVCDALVERAKATALEKRHTHAAAGALPAREKARAVVDKAEETGESSRPEVQALGDKLRQETASSSAQPGSARSTSRETSPGDGQRRGTPFEKRAREAGKMWTGGKNDDISVVLAVVEEWGGAQMGAVP